MSVCFRVLCDFEKQTQMPSCLLLSLSTAHTGAQALKKITGKKTKEPKTGKHDEEKKTCEARKEGTSRTEMQGILAEYCALVF